MYISFDYRCPECNSEASLFVRREDMDEQVCRHCVSGNPHNDVRMTRLPAATKTHFKFADQKLKP